MGTIEMEVEENNSVVQESDNEETVTKKRRHFFAKEFRQNLKSENAYTSVKEFVQLCNEETTKQDHALEFIEKGGTLPELLKVVDALDKKNASQCLPIFQAYNIVLLKILSKKPDRLLLCEESCRELLVKHFPILKTMLCLNSTSKQRKVALKLLSTMTTMSPTLAKDVLAYAQFDFPVLEILTNPATGEESSSVRTSFIHFLLSFLIEGDTGIITTFLEKRGLLASIFNGLLYDKSDLVELVLATIQNKILEDKHLSKTLKMNTFNTQVVKSLVNLYNWKGPLNKKTGNYKKRKAQTQNAVVDPVEKKNVCDCVHRFLLTLCTSKYGVIFRDPTIGLSGKVHNSLMLTVLQGLGKPWDHPLASELVSKICVVCPDLVKPVLVDVVPFLEPRVSQKWLNAVKFVRKLIDDLTPDCVGQFFEKLSTKQVSLVIQTLCAPKNIISMITQENIMHVHLGVRHEITELLHSICHSVTKYINYINNLPYFNDGDKSKLKFFTTEYLEHNLPSLSLIVKVWKKSLEPSEALEDPDVPSPHLSSHLSTILDILYEYHLICPPLVEDITNEIDSLDFLQTIEKICKENTELSSEMYVKAINLFLLCDFSAFLPTTDLFAYAVPLLLKIYSENKKSSAETTLLKLIKNSGVFEGCESEVKVWLHSLLEHGSYNDEIGSFFTSALILTNKNFLKYCKDITSLRGSVSEECLFNFKGLVESLSVDVTENKISYEKNTHVVLSPMINGVLGVLLESKSDGVEEYLNIALVHLLHAQTAPKILMAVVLQDKFSEVLNKNVLKYYRSWGDCTSLGSLKKIYRNKNIVTKLNKYLISNDNEIEMDTLEKYHIVLLSKIVIFYLTQLSRTQLLTETIQEKCFNTSVQLLTQSDKQNCFSDCLDVILKHPLLIQLFSPTRAENEIETLTTKYILDIIQELTKTKSKVDLEPYMNSYRMILLRRMHVMLQKNKKHKKPPKSTKFLEVITLLDLSVDHCTDLIKLCSELSSECLVTSENTPSGIVELNCYILNRYLTLYNHDKTIKPFDDQIVTQLGRQLLYLSSFGVEMNFETFETSLHSYILQFPHSVGCFDDQTFKSLLLRPTVNRSTARLAMILLQSYKKYFDIVLSVQDDIIDKRELVFSLLNAVPESSDEFLEKAYKKHEPIIQKVLNKPQKVAQYIVEYHQVVIRMVTKFMNEDFLVKNHKFDATETYHFEILTAMYDKCVKTTSDKNKLISGYIVTFMNLVMNVLKRPEKSEDDWKKIGSILKSFTMFLNKLINIYKVEYKDDSLGKNATFQSFSKFALKFGLQGNPNLVESLKRLSEFCSNDNEEYLGMLFEMAVSHSESLNILLDNENMVKPQLINLLLTLCQKFPSVIIKNHIPVWLGAYEGTMSLSDQCLLQLLNLYEQANVGFHEFKPYLWGKAAVTHYSVRFGVETSLLRHPKPGEVLDIFDADKIRHTVKHFPRSRMLTPSQPFCSNDDFTVYDPAFYLPLLSQLLAPESTIKWYQCKFGAIALVIMALTSDVSEVRTAACHVLARFHSHLEAAKFGKDRLLWLHFIEALCRAASKMENLHISSIAGIFMARCALIFNRPDHSLYNALANYIMARECPDINYVPEMLELLHSNDVKYIEHRNFILEVMRDGIKTDSDLKVMFRSMAFKLLTDMYNSVVMNHEGKRLILEIITSAVSLPMGARVLTSAQGLMSWLFSVIKLLGPSDNDLLSSIIHLIHKMVLAFEVEQFEKSHFNLLLCLTSIIDCLKTIRIPVDDLIKYVSILYIVYDNKPRMLTKDNLTDLLSISVKVLDCHECSYYLEYDSLFVQKPKVVEDVLEQGVYYLKLLTLKWIEVNKKTKVKMEMN